MIYYSTKRDYCEGLSVFNEILTVCELHVYELLEIVLPWLTKSREKAYLIEFFLKASQIYPPIDLLRIFLKFRCQNPKESSIPLDTEDLYCISQTELPQI